MKKALLIGCLLAFTLSFAPSAYCQDDVYASLMLGVTQPNDSDTTFTYLSTDYDTELEYDLGFGFLAAAGRYFGNARLEGEAGYFINNFKDSSSDLRIFSLLLNGYYDFKTQNTMTPYLTAGLGLASAKIEDTDTNQESDNDAVVAYQVGAGIAIALTDTTDLDLRYRYFVTSNLEFEDMTMEFASHSFYVGLSKRF